MSVYTTVSEAEIASFLTHYDVGQLIDYQGITEGIENTNYFVTTEQGQFVLTLFEQHTMAEMDYYLSVMAFFHSQAIPSAYPQADMNGQYLRNLNQRPAALVHRLAGNTLQGPASLAQCQAMGEVLAKMHNAAPAFTTHQSNLRGAKWRAMTASQLITHLPATAADLLRQELAYQADYDTLSLPKGLIHSDLFRDNALFIADKLTGVIDFYYACDDYLLYDLAVVVNDWCIDAEGYIEHNRYQALLQRYGQLRTLQNNEMTHWNKILRAAALRFWLSRLYDKYFPKQGSLTQTKDPTAYQKILQQHQSKVLVIPSVEIDHGERH